MKGAAFALLCAVALASAELNENGCPINPYIDVLIPHSDCNKFYQCLQGDLLERKCASTLVFNVETQECDWPENVDCENRIPVAPVSSEEPESEDSGNGNGNDDPSLAPEICAAEDSDGTLVAHEQCNKFYQCHNGVPVAFACAPLNLVFNPSTEACDWPENVDCGNRVPGGDGDGGNGDGGNGDDGNGDGNGEDNNGGSNSGEDGGDFGNSNGNDDPSLAAEICAAEDSDGVLVAHEQCHKFYICSNGVPVAQRCAPVDLVFNPSTGACDWPENVDCGNRVPDGDGDSGNGDGGNGDGGNGGGGNGDGNEEDNNGGSNSNEDGGDSENSNGNDDPSLAAEICAAEDSESVLVAHEQCNKFYICSNGVPVAQRCAPVDLVFNPSTGACDWPENVDCGNRVPDGDGDSGNGDGGNGDGGNGDGGNGDGNGEDNNGGSNSNEDGGDSGNSNGNDDPSLAAEICAAEDSESVLVAHEQCNKFYICSNGVPVAQRCAPVDLVFNPSTGACDWPENVDCGNRVPDGDGDSGNGDGGNGDGGNGGGGNGDGNGEDNNGGSNSNEDGGDSGNSNGNDDPSLAAEICAAEDSESVLVAHEQCNKFYICSNGVPLAQRCAPVDLVFNPSTGACDWPENVDCGNRVPDGDGDSGNGDGGNGDGGNGGGGNGDGNGEDNNGGSNSNEDGGDSGNSNGNDDPSLAAEICAAEDSESILVAHEQCNKFYICSNGVPVAQRCAPVDLVFNPSTGACDWPENVDCGNRVPDGDGDSGNGDGGNGDGGNGDGGNGDGNGEDNNGGSNSNEDGGDSGNSNGNDDPSLAAEICAAEDSESVLVAHEQCNKFYICSNGVPVAQRCAPVDLVFNPSTGACDWPENVDCGNRIPDGDGDSGNGDGGNGDGGNGDGGNGDGNGEDNNGGSNSNEDGGDSGNSNGNDDPSLAAEICAAEDSESVLVAHEQCNKFYICSNGVPLAQRCAPVDLVFNPSTGACDWPENVDCGNRVPDSDGDSGHGGDGNNDGNGDNENGEDNNISDGDSANGDGDNGNNVGGGNGNPSEAPEICAAEASDGVLVAHENCNQFYKCVEGKPVALRCYGSLLFNPNNDQCDWPENVDCNGKNPDSGNSSEDNGDDDTGNGDGGNGDGDNGNNVGGGNGNPSEAPEICAAEGSDGVLVAHENCNQFYKCVEGKPVALTCYGTLSFNPNNDQCDWPENVNCGTRYRFKSFNKHMRRFFEHFRA